MYKLAASVIVVLLGAASASGGGSQRLTVHVTPVVAMAPAFLTIRTMVEPNDENRRLNVSLDSDGYSRSSEIPLEGSNAARVNVLQFKGVPSGVYEVRATVVGTTRAIATTVQMVKIESSAGNR